MTIRTTNLSKIDPEWSGTGVAAKVKGEALATQNSRNQALYSQMRILPLGRRVLVRVGLGGHTQFMVPSGTNPAGMAKVYPDKTNERVMARQKCRVTPGYNLRLTGIFAPSGPTQTASPIYAEDSPVAALKATVVLDNGLSNVSKTIYMIPKWSKEQYKALPTDVVGALQKMTKVFEFAELATAGWTENVTATITITGQGGLRPVDISITEEPGQVARQDDDFRECTIPMVKAEVPNEYAITGKTYPDDAYYGSHQAAKTSQDQRQVLGPLLAYWTSWNEAAATVGATEGIAAQSTGTAFVDITHSSLTTWASGNPGWSMSSGGTARMIEQNGPLALRNVNAVVPVIVRAYMKSGGGGSTATVRFQTENYSLRELTSTSSTYAWVEGLAWLRCGVHQMDASNLQVLLKSSSIAFAASLQYFSIEYAGNFAVTV